MLMCGCGSIPLDSTAAVPRATQGYAGIPSGLGLGLPCFASSMMTHIRQR